MTCVIPASGEGVPLTETNSTNKEGEGSAGNSIEWQLAQNFVRDSRAKNASKSVQIAANKARALRKGAGTMSTVHTSSYRGVYGFLNRHAGDIQQLDFADLCKLLPPDLQPNRTNDKTDRRSASAHLWRSEDFESLRPASSGLHTSAVGGADLPGSAQAQWTPNTQGAGGSRKIGPAAPTALSSSSQFSAYSHVPGRALHPENASPLPRSPLLMRGGRGSFAQIDSAGGGIGDLIGASSYVTSGSMSPVHRSPGTMARQQREAQGTMASGMVAHAARARPATAQDQPLAVSDEAAKQGAVEDALVTEMRTMMMELYVPPSAGSNTLKPVSSNLTRRLHQRRRLENAIQTQPISSSSMCASPTRNR